MKTKSIFSVLMLILMVLISCKKELEPQESSGAISPSAVENSTVLPSATPRVMVNSNQNPSLPQQNSNQNAVGMNPPHGQPSHRCDIAVGAPLNSPPNKSKPNSAVTTSTITNSNAAITKSAAPAVITKPGMNPPHGQAGHRCDIAVGAPLDSPATKVVPPATNTSTNSQVPGILKLDSTATGTK